VIPNGQQISQLRGEADLTQWQLAQESGYGLRTIGKIEDGQPTGAGTLAAVATVLSRRLKRSIGLSDLIRRLGEGDCCQCHAAQPPCLVQEGLKLLDFSCWRPAPLESRVLLSDIYRFRRVAGELGTLQFHYATAGPSIEGRCLSHADNAF